MIAQVPIRRVQSGKVLPCQDSLAIEEPLEIRLGYALKGRRYTKTLAITMRTPGQDEELAVGFLLSEGILHQASQLQEVHAPGPNEVHVDLTNDAEVDWPRLERHVYTTSSCGVCGKTSLEALATMPRSALPLNQPKLPASVVHTLPATLRQQQAVFSKTGGLHAAALFDSEGRLLLVREDIGRHNAVDKLVGHELLARRVPLSGGVLLVSGRASFELMQKALMAGIPVLAAVGAPSSLAVELAVQHQMTLLGFVRDDRFNIYSGAWRVV